MISTFKYADRFSNHLIGGRLPISYVLKRLAIFFVTVWLATTLLWLIPRLAPGDPASAMVGRMMANASFVDNSSDLVHEWSEKFGLNEPAYIQYGKYLLGCAKFDFGFSLANFPTPASDIVMAALPWTLGLLLVTVSVSFIIGNLVGALMVWPGTPKTIQRILPSTLIFTSVPTILSALFILYVFAFKLNWFPMRGAYGIGLVPGLNRDFILSVLWHGFLPCLSIITVTFGYWALGMRGLMVNVQGEDYVKFAYAKGLPASKVFFRYVLRNAILPQITTLALAFGTLITGQILVEYIFGYPGMGTVIYNSIIAQDYSVMQGASFIIVLITSVSVLILDLAYPFLDPRITFEGRV